MEGEEGGLLRFYEVTKIRGKQLMISGAKPSYLAFYGETRGFNM